MSNDTPRERRELDPGETCPDCGGKLRVVGEDVSELLEMITARLKVIKIARGKKSCPFVQPPDCYCHSGGIFEFGAGLPVPGEQFVDAVEDTG